jgi:hypothetical protein
MKSAHISRLNATNRTEVNRFAIYSEVYIGDLKCQNIEGVFPEIECNFWSDTICSWRP